MGKKQVFHPPPPLPNPPRNVKLLLQLIVRNKKQFKSEWGVGGGFQIVFTKLYTIDKSDLF